jgi:nicotinate-nucleotide pyrophosphorylase (carboxylating)
MPTLSLDTIKNAVRTALAEDIGSGDATTLATVPTGRATSAQMVAREDLVLAGLDLALESFRQLSSDLTLREIRRDGDHLRKGDALLEIRGPAGPILTAERVALNFVQRLSGIATLTRQFVRAIAGTPAAILDTRKTTPGWRTLEKYAVSCGGGRNHRSGLFDLIFIKDNHLAALRGELPNPVAAAVRRAREKYPNLKIEVEADTLEQVSQALEAGADIILLDNMPLGHLHSAVKLVVGRAKLEASGGVTLQTVRAIAETGVDFISVGALTHSARSVDIALDFHES